MFSYYNWQPDEMIGKFYHDYKLFFKHLYKNESFIGLNPIEQFIFPLSIPISI